jgi:hypothetical protein
MALIKLVAESSNLGHKHPRSSLVYGAVIDPSSAEGRAEQFMRDALKLSTREMVEKWYGGQRNAGRFINEVVGALIAQHRRPEREQ